MFRCPNPQEWARVYDVLSRFHEDSADRDHAPPKPLILNGWVFSSSGEKHQRWLQTVVWASSHGCDHVTSSVVDADFVVWDSDERSWQPQPRPRLTMLAADAERRHCSSSWRLRMLGAPDLGR